MKPISFLLSYSLFAILMGSCQCGSPVPPLTYKAWISYRNSKAEDLLDSNVTGYFDFNAIKVDGLTPLPMEIIAPGSSWSGLGFPNGRYLNIGLNTSKEKSIIRLSNTVTDTLYYSFSGTSLISCKYNGTNVPVSSGTVNFLVSVNK